MSIDKFIKIVDNYSSQCQQELIKQAKIKKLPSGEYRVLSKKNKNLGTFDSKEKAKKRLKQVEYFKYLDTLDAQDSRQEIDLTNLKEISFSALMRELNKKATKEQVHEYLKIYKLHFDEAIKNRLKKPEIVALKHSLVKFEKKYILNINKKLTKTAALDELGNPAIVGNYLANIVKFILNRISSNSRQNAISKLKNKFKALNVNELAMKKMPASSALGQSITFVKTVLFNHDPKYIRNVLDNLVRYL